MPGGSRIALTAAEPTHREGDDHHDEADLQQQADHRGDAAEPAEEATAQERSEEAGAEKAGHEAATEARTAA